MSYVNQIKPSESQNTSSKCRFVFVKQLFCCKNMPDVKSLTSEEEDLTIQKEEGEKKKSMINMPQKYVQESYCKIVFSLSSKYFLSVDTGGKSSTLCPQFNKQQICEKHCSTHQIIVSSPFLTHLKRVLL